MIIILVVINVLDVVKVVKQIFINLNLENNNIIYYIILLLVLFHNYSFNFPLDANPLLSIT